MDTVYDKLLQLQKMPRAWDDWKEYRQKLSDWVVAQTEKSSTLLILGAGACNDYNLCQFASHFSKIYLLDLDSFVVEKALTSQVKGNSCETRFQIIEGDLLGISPTMYRRFCSRLDSLIRLYGKEIDFDELTKIALDEMEVGYDSREHCDTLFPTNSVDYCLACGLHSQLNSMYPWIWEAYSQALGKTNLKVPFMAREFNNKYIPQLHTLMFQAAKKGVLLAMEENRIGIEGGVEGAYQGILDIKKRIENRPALLLDESRLIWPFHLREQILYSMKLYALSSTSENHSLGYAQKDL